MSKQQISRVRMTINTRRSLCGMMNGGHNFKESVVAGVFPSSQTYWKCDRCDEQTVGPWPHGRNEQSLDPRIRAYAEKVAGICSYIPFLGYHIANKLVTRRIQHIVP
jgi:hypothetical protein